MLSHVGSHQLRWRMAWAEAGTSGEAVWFGHMMRPYGEGMLLSCAVYKRSARGSSHLPVSRARVVAVAEDQIDQPTESDAALVLIEQ